MKTVSTQDQKAITGVGFDQHYTDSALKLLAPRSYRQHRKWVRTKRSVPKQEVLVSLLLFGKAYLSRPTWLYETRFPEGFPELERYEREDLIEWMPEDVYSSSYDYLRILVLRLLQKAYMTDYCETISLDVLEDKRAFRQYGKFLLEREIIDSDISHDIAVMIEKLFYLSPLVQSNLEHLGFTSEAPEALLLWPAINGAPTWIPFSGEAPLEFYEQHPEFKEFIQASRESELGRGSFHGRLAELEALDTFDDEMEGESDISWFRNEFATVLDAAASSLAAERFSARTALPFKTRGDVNRSERPKTLLGPEAYQLLKIQFQDLRYPVVQTIEDVLRLRDDPHLRIYRSVIAEYSERLRTELESERPQVVKEFRKDMQTALNSLTAVKRWSRIIDLSFYVSIPLIIIGMFSGLPISDIVAIPLTTYAKIVSYRKRKELDWILFGRSS